MDVFWYKLRCSFKVSNGRGNLLYLQFQCKFLLFSQNEIFFSVIDPDKKDPIVTLTSLQVYLVGIMFFGMIIFILYVSGSMCKYLFISFPLIKLLHPSKYVFYFVANSNSNAFNILVCDCSLTFNILLLYFYLWDPMLA